MQFAKARRSHRMAEISVVPLIDLFLNILVFFLVTTSFRADSVFFVDLPVAKESDALARQGQLVIGVSASGEIALNKRSMTVAELSQALSKVPLERREGLPVIIRADRRALHGRVVSVIDVIREKGYRNVGMATKAELSR